MAVPWRFVSSPTASATQVAALDAALLERAAHPLLRTWILSEAATFAGAHEDAAPDSVRRPTGGGTFPSSAGSEGWSLILPTEEEPAEVVERVACAAAAALARFGVQAGFRDPDRIEADGRRVGWVGGASLGMNVLVQGMFFDPPSNAAQALKEDFSRLFGADISDGTLTPEEAQADVAPARPDPPKLEGVSGELLTEGGLVRATIAPGEGRNRIRAARFTGTFNAYPAELVPLLEETVSGVSIDEAAGRIEDFFAQNPGRVAGVEPGELFTALSLAFMKVRLAASSAPDPAAWKKGQL